MPALAPAALKYAPAGSSLAPLVPPQPAHAIPPQQATALPATLPAHSVLSADAAPPAAGAMPAPGAGGGTGTAVPLLAPSTDASAGAGTPDLPSHTSLGLGRTTPRLSRQASQAAAVFESAVQGARLVRPPPTPGSVPLVGCLHRFTRRETLGDRSCPR